MAASSLKARLTLDVMPDEGRPVLRRQRSLTAGGGSPKVDWRATSPRVGGGALRRAQSVGSALSEFVGGGAARKALEESCAMMRRSGSRGCLEGLGAGGNARAAADEEDREWDWNPRRPVGFPSPQFLSQSFGKDTFPRPAHLKRASSTRKTAHKSIVAEQAQESFDSLKDRLESSLRTQPECSFVPPAAADAPSLAALSPCRDFGVLGLARGATLSALPRSLKRRKKERGARPCAMSNAVSALVFILKSMHGHALVDPAKRTPTQRDMALSLAWLFQQVFAATPEYMLAVLVLVAEFTVHALGANIILASAPSTRPATKPVAAGNPAPKLAVVPTSLSREPTLDELADAVSPEEDAIMRALMVEAMEELQATAGWAPPPIVAKEAMMQLVAPVRVAVSPDAYLCFDRTELEYQLALATQPTNALLLSNYAQFLFVVRHDNNRAEEYFHRAIRADPSDGDVLGRFASFLWLGRGDKETAERAFRAAAALDPANPYHAGNYSHFLWHSEDSTYRPLAATCVVGSE